MRYFWKILFLFGFSSASAFANTNALINQEIARSNQILKSFQGSFSELKASSVEDAQQYQNLMQNLKKQQQGKVLQGTVQKAPNAILFVSFSMPDLALKQALLDGKKYHIPVVLRGLYKNSFQETGKKIFELVKEKKQGGIAINPLWFREFNIQTVPALVLRHGNDFDVIYGNITLQQALKIIVEKGEAQEEARAILMY